MLILLIVQEIHLSQIKKDQKVNRFCTTEGTFSDNEIVRRLL